MIRRLSWLIAGVLLGVTGYRRATRLARAFALGGPASSRARMAARPHGRELMRGAADFAHDVREGMELYTDRHPRLAGRTLEGQQTRAHRPGSAIGVDNAKEGR
ncbi:MAG TPA: hypothetical protein VMC83_13115 [Streptosporangiaceae bacterium]|nr:hypothetical protein [Streptosporangiaceae bacterium]